MHFDILTLFPEAFESFTKTSLIGKAIENKIISIKTWNIRDFTENKHKKVDDVPYGGGAGMVMACQPLFDCIEHVKKQYDDNAPVIFLTPHGETLSQEIAEKLSGQYTTYNIQHTKKSSSTPPLSSSPASSRLIFLCGHYEGIDQRVRDELVDREISIGNYVLTGGEIPAQICIDSIARLIPGVIGKAESHQEESFSEKLGRDNVEYPHYTRPEDFRDLKVPEILLSGHHANIESWRISQCKKKKS